VKKSYLSYPSVIFNLGGMDELQGSQTVQVHQGKAITKVILKLQGGQTTNALKNWEPLKTSREPYL
jgi:hypothetical protein